MGQEQRQRVRGERRTAPSPPGGRATRRGFVAGVTGVAAGLVGTAAGQQTTDEGGTTTGQGTAAGGGTVEVVVGPGGDLVFEPASLEIPPGTTVRFTWDSDLHNIVVENQPNDADWSGTPGGEGETYDTGYEYTHTFDVEGTYDYYCSPHRAAGMEATITVTAGATLPGEDTGGGGTGDGSDGTAGNTIVVTGIGLGLTAVTVAVIYYWDLYSWKAPPEMRSAADRRADSVPARHGEEGAELGTTHGGPMYEAEVEPHVTESVDNDAFDPTGTVVLLIGYFLLVALLWLFMYFVEFLGNGPEVIG